MTHVLEVERLSLTDGRSGRLLVSDSSWHVRQGSCLAIVGESGSGKSISCKAVMRLNKPVIRQSGVIRYNGSDLSQLSERQMREMRGKRLCMIMQNGMRAFDAASPVGLHVRQTLKRHYGWSRSRAETEITRAMKSVELKDPISILNRHPHQLSGGMLQRLMIALALTLKPELIIADEPTTALDAVSQYEVLEQLSGLRSELNCSMILVSHDLGVVSRMADEALVMKDGRIVEAGKPADLFNRPAHPYTRHLAQAKQAVTRHFNAVMGGDGPVDR